MFTQEFLWRLHQMSICINAPCNLKKDTQKRIKLKRKKINSAHLKTVFIYLNQNISYKWKKCVFNHQTTMSLCKKTQSELLLSSLYQAVDLFLQCIDRKDCSCVAQDEVSSPNRTPSNPGSGFHPYLPSGTGKIGTKWTHLAYSTTIKPLL